MADAIQYAVHRTRTEPHNWRTPVPTGRFTVALDNLTKAEAADVLILLGQMQDMRADGREWPRDDVASFEVLR
jgi:hypothetical protein